MWIAVNPLHSHTELMIVETVEELAREGATVLKLRLDCAQHEYRGGFCWFACVEAVKSHAGIKAFWTWTPYQLYKLMRKM